MAVAKPGRNAAGRRHTSRCTKAFAFVLTSGLLLQPRAGLAQSAGINQAGPGYLHGQAGTDAVPAQGTSAASAKIEQMRKAEREQRLSADAAKLLQLSSELKFAIDNNPKDQLSLEVLRKAAEIEKLARDIKQWMKS